MSWLLWTALAHAGCTERPVVPAEQGAQSTADPCIGARVRASGRLFATVPEAGISRGVSLPDARAELTVGGKGDVSGRMAVIPFQSGGSAGYVGVAGESWVPVLQIAEARWDWKPAGLAVAGGLVDEPWVAHELRTWGYRPIAPGAAQESGVVERADVGAWAAWSSPSRWVTTILAVHAGEGWRTRERNNGVNLTGMAIVRPLEGSDHLEAALYGREGSKGLLQARDHRAGLAITGGPDQVAFGGSAVLGWGQAGDGSLTPAVGSIFAGTRDLPAAGWLRVDHQRTVRSDPSTGTTLARIGGGPRLPFTADGPQPAYLVAGADLRLPASGSGPTAGQPTPSTTVYLQIAADIGAAWALEGT